MRLDNAADGQRRHNGKCVKDACVSHGCVVVCWCSELIVGVDIYASNARCGGRADCSQKQLFRFARSERMVS